MADPNDVLIKFTLDQKTVKTVTKQITALIKKLNKLAVIKLSVDTKGVKKKVAAVRKQLDSIRKIKVAPKIDIDVRKVKALQTVARTNFRSLTKSATAGGGAVATLGTRFDRLNRAVRSGRIGLLALGAILQGITNQIRTFGQETEKAFASVNTIIRVTPVELAKIREEAEAVARTFSVDLATSGDALFNIVSAGFSGAEALEVLRVSALGARAGMGSLADVSRALIPVMNSFGDAVEGPEAVLDILFKTVERGVLTSQELGRVIGTVVPVAAQFGVTFEEVNAAIATLTVQGNTASEAATFLRGTLLAIARPAERARKEFERLGIATGVAGLRQQGFAKIISDVSVAVAKGDTEIVKLFRSQQALRGVAALSGNFQLFAENINLMENAAGAATNAFDEFERTAGRAIERLFGAFTRIRQLIGEDFIRDIEPTITTLRNFIDANEKLVVAFGRVAVSIGGALGVLLTLRAGFSFIGPVIAGLFNLVIGLVTAFTSLTGVVQILSFAIGRTLVVALFALRAALLGIVIIPIILGVVAGIRAIVNEIGGIGVIIDLFIERILFLKRVAIDALRPIGEAFLSFISVVTEAFTEVFGGTDIIDSFDIITNSLANGIRNLGDFISRFVQNVSNFLEPVLIPAFEALREILVAIEIAFNQFIEVAVDSLELLLDVFGITFSGISDEVDKTGKQLSGFQKLIVLVTDAIKLLASPAVVAVFGVVRIAIAGLVTGFGILFEAVRFVVGSISVSLGGLSKGIRLIVIALSVAVSGIAKLGSFLPGIGDSIKKLGEDVTEALDTASEKLGVFGERAIEAGTSQVSEALTNIQKIANRGRTEIDKGLDSIFNATEKTKELKAESLALQKIQDELASVQKISVELIKNQVESTKGVFENKARELGLTENQQARVRELIDLEGQASIEAIKRSVTTGQVVFLLKDQEDRLDEIVKKLGSQKTAVELIVEAQEKLESVKRIQILEREERVIRREGLGIAENLKLSKERRDVLVRSTAEARVAIRNESQTLLLNIQRRQALGQLTFEQAAALKSLVKSEVDRGKELLRNKTNVEDILDTELDVVIAIKDISEGLSDTAKRALLIKDALESVQVARITKETGKLVKQFGEAIDSARKLTDFTEETAVSLTFQVAELEKTLELNLENAETEEERNEALDKFNEGLLKVKDALEEAKDISSGISEDEAKANTSARQFLRTIKEQKTSLENITKEIQGTQEEIKKTEALQKSVNTVLNQIIRNRVKATKSIADDLQLLRLQRNEQLKTATTAQQTASIILKFRLEEKRLIEENARASQNALNKTLEIAKKVNEEVRGLIDALVEENRRAAGEGAVVDIEQTTDKSLVALNKVTDVNLANKLVEETILKLKRQGQVLDDEELKRKEALEETAEKLFNIEAKRQDLLAQARAKGFGTRRSKELVRQADELLPEIDRLTAQQIFQENELDDIRADQEAAQEKAELLSQKLNDVLKTRIPLIEEENKKLAEGLAIVQKRQELSERGIDVAQAQVELRGFGVESDALKTEVDKLNVLRDALRTAQSQLVDAKQADDADLIEQVGSQLDVLTQSIDKQIQNVRDVASGIKGLGDKLAEGQSFQSIAEAQSPDAELDRALQALLSEDSAAQVQEIDTNVGRIAQLAIAANKAILDATSVANRASQIVEQLAQAEVIPKVAVALNAVADKVQQRTQQAQASAVSTSESATRLATAVQSNTDVLNDLVEVGPEFTRAAEGLENVNGSLTAFSGNVNAFAGGVNNTIAVILQTLQTNNELIQQALTQLNQATQAQIEGVSG